MANRLDFENVIIVISVVCLFLAIYLAMLSTQMIDIKLRMNLVDWAIYCLVGGIAILGCWLLLQIIKKFFFEEKEKISTIF